MSEAVVTQDLLSPRLKRGLLGLVVLGVAALIVGLGLHAQGVYAGILAGFLFIIDLGLGGALFMAINASAGARWDTVFRRVPQAMAETLFFSSLLVFVFMAAVSRLYPWAKPGFMDNPIPELATKKDWLRPDTFSLRALAYVLIWTGFTGLILRLHWKQDRDGVDRSTLIRKLSMVFCIVFAYTFCLSAFDWLMSIEPTFYSTIFGIYCFAGVMQCGFAVVLLLVLYLNARGAFKDQLREQHLHDLGKWLFAFSCFWAYTWFFQYMLIWYADLPGQNQFFVARSGFWCYWVGAVVFGRFCVPFFGLASQKVKKSPKALATVAGLVVAFHWLNLVELILPGLGRDWCNPFVLLLPLASGAGFLLLFFRAFSKRPALPRRDAAYAYSRRYLT